MTRILITGSSGQLGSALVRRLGPSCVPFDHVGLDITDSRQIFRVIGKSLPATVIHCAAYTQVDQAESESELCMATNATSVAYFAAACREHGATLVYISTDYVFGRDGHAATGWREADRPAPLSVYGRSKLIGEENAASWERHFIVRTCGLYGHTPRRANFVEKILDLAKSGGSLRVVNDQRCSPTYVEHLAEAILFLCRTPSYGLYHVANQGGVSWYDFATEIVRLAGLDIPVEPISSDKYRAAAARPTDSVLDTTKYHALGGPAMPEWREALSEYLARRVDRD